MKNGTTPVPLYSVYSGSSAQPSETVMNNLFEILPHTYITILVYEQSTLCHPYLMVVIIMKILSLGPDQYLRQGPPVPVDPLSSGVRTKHRAKGCPTYKGTGIFAAK